MTTGNPYAGLAEIVADLSSSMPREERFRRLLTVFRRYFPCDAIALLERVEGHLVPRAVIGLSEDALGRHFTIQQHPRLAQILESRGPVRFAADSALPDPYDGLIDNADNHLYVHDCMGATLCIDDVPWGVITLDSLDPHAFDDFDMAVFEAYLSVAAATVRAAGWIEQLEERLEKRRRIALERSASHDSYRLLGDSETMEKLRVEAKTVALSDLTVLIMGETGVGKELVANLIHRHSARSSEPMVYVNCAALPEALAESELFGHVKGAFSGADDSRIGKFELAHEGTLFLDEVGELPLNVQSKILRTLQNGEIQRVGSDQHHIVNVRLVAATNRDLKKEVSEGRFRADLYHRLSVYPLLVPPLREHAEDILPLAGYFLERDHRRLGIRGVRLSRKAQYWLRQSQWPGNVRELEHALSRAIIRAVSEGQDPGSIIEIDTRHLGIRPAGEPAQVDRQNEKNKDQQAPLNEMVEDFKRQLLIERLAEHGGNKAATARSLGVDRGNFSRLLKKLDIVD